MLKENDWIKTRIKDYGFSYDIDCLKISTGYYSRLERSRYIVEKQSKERQIATQNNDSGKAVKVDLPEQEKGQTRDKLAKSIGTSGKTYDHLVKVPFLC